MRAGIVTLVVLSSVIIMLAAHVHILQQQQQQHYELFYPSAKVAHADMTTQYNPPAIQYKSGTLVEDITCKEEHVLAIRTNQNPICITPETAELMIKRGGIIESVIGHTLAHQKDANTEDVVVTEKNSGIVDIASTDNASSTDKSTDIPTSNPITLTNKTIVEEMESHSNSSINYNADYNVNAKNNSQIHDSKDIGNSKAVNGSHNNSREENTSAATSSSSATTTPQQPHNTHQGRVSTVPASTMSIVNFYLTDDDLNRSPNAAETIPINNLFKFTINDILINGPDTMIETGPNTGQFYIRLQLPETIDGRPLNQNDVVDVTYIDQTDSSGEKYTVTRSFELSSTYAQINSEGSGKKRIGHEFTLRIYDPDSNTDSREENKIPLSRFGFESKGNIRVTLDHRAFDANRSHMIETGPNTGVFEVTIKIPRQIDGKIIHIGDWYKITYDDYTTPSGTAEEIVLRGKIGL